MTAARRIAGRVALITAAAGAALLTGAPVAGAHVGTSPSEAPAGSRQVIDFRIGHGCDGSPTTKLAIKIPEGVVAVTPEHIAGWTVEVETGPITPYDDHGTQVSEGVTQVTWTGGPLPDGQYQTFGLSLMLPDTPGETVSFPAVQTCEQGETPWIELPADGGAEPEHPAPAVVLTEATGGEHHHGTDDGTDDTDGAARPGGPAGDLAFASDVEDAKDTAGTAQVFGIMGMALGAVGLALGGGAFAARRKAPEQTDS